MSNDFPPNHPYASSGGAIMGGLLPVESSNQGLIKEETHLLKRVDNYELQVKQTEALTTLANGIKDIASFLSGGGLLQITNANVRGNIMSAIFGGLATKDGRNALDARTIKQNSLEVVQIIEEVFNKMHERLSSKEPRDPDIKEPQE